jgi:hypothetical protein
MSRITYFAVLPFSRDTDGDFLAEAAIDVRSAAEAKGTAARMAVAERGAVAFSKTGDPQLGEWDDAVILGPIERTTRWMDRKPIGRPPAGFVGFR